MPTKAAADASAEATATETMPAKGDTPTYTLTYSDPVQIAEKLVRVTASDGQGNTLVVDAETADKAQAALRAAFKALKEK